jgi:predicted phage tail protein
MPLGRILGLCALPLGLFAVVLGVVLIQGSSLIAGAVFAVLGGALLLAGVCMLVTGRPRTLPFQAARPGSKPGPTGRRFRTFDRTCCQLDGAGVV